MSYLRMFLTNAYPVFIGSLMLLTSNLVLAQNIKPFEGTITYSMSFEGLPPEAAAMMAASEMKTFIKKEMLRTDMNMGFAKTITISDLKNQIFILLADAMGQKTMIKTTPQDTVKREEKSTVPTIKYLDDTKEIAGYKCKKAEITTIDKEWKSHILSVYYTDELPYSNYNSQFEGLKGCAMEFEINEGGVIMKITVKKVSREAVTDDTFAIPEGYTEATLNR